MALSIEARTLSIETKMVEDQTLDGVLRNTRKDNDAFSIRIHYPHDTEGIAEYAAFVSKLIQLMKETDPNVYFDEYLQSIH